MNLKPKSEPEIWYIKIYPFMENIGACKHEPSSEFHNGAIKNYFPVVKKSDYDDLKLENEELRRELQGIISKCEWYATVHQGPDHEVHHALKVEIPEEARAALKNGGGE